MSKSLKIIQTVMKILNILCKVAFVSTIVGTVLCVIGGSCVFAAFNGEKTFLDFVVDGSDIKAYLVSESGLSLDVLGAYSFSSAIILAGVAVELGFKIKYFTKEINDGTPFTYDGAKALKNAAIFGFIASIVADLVAYIVFFVITINLTGVQYDSSSFNAGMLFSFLTMLFGSVIFKYGAEQTMFKTSKDVNY